MPAVAPGSYSIIAKADGPNAIGETNETNNTTIKPIAIGPDLTVSQLQVPGAAHPGGTISVSPTTANSGGDTAGSSTTKIYLHPASGPDVFLGSRSVPSLGPGATDAGAVSVTIPASTPIGSYSILAVADDGNVVAEANEGNNTKTKSININ